jgi:hypothetical protein
MSEPPTAVGGSMVQALRAGGTGRSIDSSPSQTAEGTESEHAGVWIFVAKWGIDTYHHAGFL